MDKRINDSPFLGKPLDQNKKQEIKDFFNRTFELYENLYGCLNSTEAYQMRPEILRHPLIFYFGHTATFFINKLIVSKQITVRVNEAFESLFAVGVDEMSWDDLNNESIDWPQVEEVVEYRKEVKKIVNKVIDCLPLGDLIDWKHPAWIVLMGIEHELIHLETTSVLIRQLDLKYINTKNKDWEACSDFGNTETRTDFVTIEAEKIVLGISKPSEYYGWDNEYGQETQLVKSFTASPFLVSNAVYLEFVQAGGYQNLNWWTSDGASWVQYRKATHPTFWIADNSLPHGYRFRNMISEIPLPVNWPAEVNYYEAEAFCNWYSEAKGKKVRLPSEKEWHCMYNQHFIGNKDSLHRNTNNYLAHYASSCPVNKFKHGSLYDICGNVWQWTASNINPFKGFESHPYYDDFSIPTFDDRHTIIKGGSWISGGNCARKESRYAFRKHFFQHAGFRLVHSEHELDTQSNTYETDEASSIYLDAHYQTGYFNKEAFAVAIINYAAQFWNNNTKHKALDVGCSVGRSSFELSRYFDEVVGIDFSSHFIKHAHQLRDLKTVQYKTLIEGAIYEEKSINLKDLDLEGNEKKVEFYQADACNLPVNLKGYDFVLAANLLDRLYDPESFLTELTDRMNNGALLVISSPFTWKEEFTEKNKWLGGYNTNKGSVFSSEVLKTVLATHFEFLSETEEIPFILKETSRKYQHIFPYVGIWKKKN